MTPRTFDTAKERQEYHASLPLPEKRSWIDRQVDKEHRDRVRRVARESAKKLEFLKDPYRRKEAQAAVEALVARNARAAAKVYGPKGFVEPVHVPQYKAVYRAIRQAS